MTSFTDLLHQLYYEPVETRLTLARDLFARFGDTFREHTTLCNELDTLVDRAEQLRLHMEQMDLGRLCVQCSTGDGGGCCSAYMAGETDGIQLLMNMLAGIDVRIVRDDGVECCFLGSQGCLFPLKPMFCLNYNCSKILNLPQVENLTILEKLTGALLSKQYKVEQMLLDIIAAEIKR